MTDKYSPVIDYWFDINENTQGFRLTPIIRKLKRKKKPVRK